jgi:hypothetical protein
MRVRGHPTAQLITLARTPAPEARSQTNLGVTPF